jgi:hypothetical protein
MGTTVGGRARVSRWSREVALPEPRGRLEEASAHVAQSAEHFLGKEEVTGSSPVVSFQGVGSHRLTVRTPLFQGGDRGSIPRGSVVQGRAGVGRQVQVRA